MNNEIKILEVKLEKFNIENVKILEMSNTKNTLETFKNIYEKLLINAVELAYLRNYTAEYINVAGVLDKALELLNQEKLSQWLTNRKVLTDEISVDEGFKCQDLIYEIDKKIIKEKFTNTYHVVDSGIIGLTLSRI